MLSKNWVIIMLIVNWLIVQIIKGNTIISVYGYSMSDGN